MEWGVRVVYWKPPPYTKNFHHIHCPWFNSIWPDYSSYSTVGFLILKCNTKKADFFCKAQKLVEEISLKILNMVGKCGSNRLKLWVWNVKLSLFQVRTDVKKQVLTKLDASRVFWQHLKCYIWKWHIGQFLNSATKKLYKFFLLNERACPPRGGLELCSPVISISAYREADMLYREADMFIICQPENIFGLKSTR